MLRRELIFLHSASGDGCNDRPRLLATKRISIAQFASAAQEHFAWQPSRSPMAPTSTSGPIASPASFLSTRNLFAFDLLPTDRLDRRLVVAALRAWQRWPGFRGLDFWCFSRYPQASMSDSARPSMLMDS